MTVPTWTDVKITARGFYLTHSSERPPPGLELMRRINTVCTKRLPYVKGPDQDHFGHLSIDTLYASLREKARVLHAESRDKAVSAWCCSGGRRRAFREMSLLYCNTEASASQCVGLAICIPEEHPALSAIPEELQALSTIPEEHQALSANLLSSFCDDLMPIVLPHLDTPSLVAFGSASHQANRWVIRWVIKQRPAIVLWEVVKDHFHEVGRFLAEGANPNVTDASGNTPLHLAQGTGMAEQLLNYHADPNLPNQKGEVPLWVHVQRPLLVRALCKAGANVDFCNAQGQTPLHQAAATGCTSTLRELLDYRANIHLQDREGNTPLHLAAAENHWGECNVLIKQGANRYTLNHQGQYPADLASYDFCKSLLVGQP